MRQSLASSLYLVHVLEHVFALDDDLDAQVLADGFQLFLHGVEVGGFGIQRGQHGHGEDAVQDSLADVVDVRVAGGQRGGHGCHNAAAVLAQDGDDALHVDPFLAQCRALN